MVLYRKYIIWKSGHRTTTSMKAQEYVEAQAESYLVDQIKRFLYLLAQNDIFGLKLQNRKYCIEFWFGPRV